MKKRLQSRSGMLGDVLRRATLPGVGEIRLPGELRRALVSNIESFRETTVDIFAKEISKVLAKVDVKHIVDDVLRNYTLRIEARVDLVPKSDVAKSERTKERPVQRKKK